MKKRQLRLAGLAAALWLQAGGLAEAAPQTNDTAGLDQPPINGNMTGYLVWVIAALLFVLGLIVLLIKWLSARNRGWGTSRSLRSLGGIPLGPNKSLQVVELAGRVYVVGVGDGITLLDKIEDAEAVQSVIESMDRQTSSAWSPQTFTDYISRIRNRGAGRQPADEPWQEAASFQELLDKKLKRQADRKQQVEQLLNEQNQNDRLLDE